MASCGYRHGQAVARRTGPLRAGASGRTAVTKRTDDSRANLVVRLRWDYSFDLYVKMRPLGHRPSGPRRVAVSTASDQMQCKRSLGEKERLMGTESTLVDQVSQATYWDQAIRPPEIAFPDAPCPAP